jgi:hypothetical protein
VTDRAAPGRSCPLHYHYGPAVFKRAAAAHLQNLDVLYVVGGLYGNLPALHQVLRLFERERGPKRLVFNGDFHWFDAEAAAFEQVQREVLGFEALRGNVETELAGQSNDAGCGCAYPDWVGDGVVERSNRILARLRSASTAAQRQQLAALPMWQRADVGPLRLGLVHGDAQSLAGWGFAAETLPEPAARAQARRWFEQAQVHAFACTHTCLPVMQRLHTDDGPRWVLNNGAAGMPNFQNDRAGLITRIALHPRRGPERRYGVSQQGVCLEALAVEHDTAAFERQFLASWPVGSDAHVSYFQRIQQGPDYTVVRAVRDEVADAA